ISSLCWDTESRKNAPKQEKLPFLEKPDNPVIAFLSERGEVQINELAIAMNLPVHQLSPMLFELEMAGHIKALPGGIYKIN
ncbi:MAG: DNA-protecting protein DprA, partial [Dysgonamonadaceae bacterium]|nr:DNA-protecting protein DprA [Dysgonamonadaceae bacterium]